MTISDDRKAYFAQILDDAQQTATPVTQITAEAPELTMEEGYDIQRLLVGHRYNRGETLVGMKMGLTSKAKMEQVGVHRPIYGHLTSAMRLNDGDPIVRSEHIHPRAEPEICFVMGEALAGPATTEDALEAIDYVTAAIEVIDSRYRDFEFTLEDVVADNSSSSKFVLGPRRVSADELDLGNIGMVLNLNGEAAETGSTAAILEHPLRSLIYLANMLAERGEVIEAGSLVLSGGATAAIHIDTGDHVLLETDGLGTVELRVRE
ncbi:MAG: 2-keto-4-pentenoate hydratase [Myxococcota bacterium]